MMKVGLNNPMSFRQAPRNNPVLRRQPRQHSGDQRNSLTYFLSRGIVVLILAYFAFLARYEVPQNNSNSIKEQAQAQAALSKDHKVTGNKKIRLPLMQKNQQELTASGGAAGGGPQPTCAFRTYPPRRYYGLTNEDVPDFLLSADYIYGEQPQLLVPLEQNAVKLCVDQSDWYPQQQEEKEDPPTSERSPFADGTNPSLVSLKDNSRIDSSLSNLFPSEARFLATICMTDSQCAWKDSPQEQDQYNISPQSTASTVRAILLVLDEHFQTLMEATIYMEMDGSYGRKFPRPVKEQPSGDVNIGATTTTLFAKRMFALDDARLFTNRGKIWVSYREGKGFGFDKQVLNELHFTFHNENENNKRFSVLAKAAETATFCCGRNMALLDNVDTNQLQSLSWADPVTVITVDDGRGERPSLATAAAAASATSEQEQHGRLLLEDITSTATYNGNDIGSSHHRRRHRRRRQLREKVKKSHFHGTNGFMVYLPKTQEYLGIGHFHRPEGRAANDYARFGHHYTHAWFTIPASPPFRLQRLSREFLLPSQADPKDGEIIQFLSGLELVERENGKQVLALAYGINDCEGAAVYIDMDQVDWLLRDVPEGKEVLDLMAPLGDDTQR
jgi:hypothetical protein